MRLFLTFFILLCFVNQTTAQEKHDPTLITEQFDNQPLKSVLLLLKSKYNITTAYGDAAIQDIYVSANFESSTVADCINRLLLDTSLSYEMVDTNLIIIKETVPDTQALYLDLVGSLSDATSGESLPFAYVWLDESNRSLVTNVDGHFSLPRAKLPISLKISYLGYQDTTIVISNSQTNPQLNIKMRPTTQNLEEVVISQTQSDNFRLDEVAGKVSFNPSIAKIMPVAGEVDVFRALQLLPGINATNETSSGLYVRGGTANQNLVLLDGFTVYHVDHLFGYFSAFNPYAIKSMQIYKSGYGAAYGGRVSSIIDMTTKDGNKHKTAGSLGLNLMSINTTLEVPLSDNNTTLFFSARRSYTDVYSTKLFDDIFSNFSSSFSNETASTNTSGMGGTGANMHPRNINNQSITTDASSIDPTFYYSDLNVKVSSNLNDKNRLSVSFYNSKDILNFTELTTNVVDDTLKIDRKSIGFINWGNIGSSVKFSHIWNSHHFSNFLMTYSKYESEYNDITTSSSIGQSETTIANATTDQNNGMQDITLRWDHEFQTSNASLFKYGVSSSLYSTRYTFIADGETIVNENQENKTLTNAYMEYNVNPINQLSIALGIRGSYFSPTDQFYFVPRLSLRYKFTEELTFTAAYGQYNQFINQTNTKNVLQGSRDFWLLANDDNIPVQHASHYSVGISYDKNNLTLSAEAYSKQFDGLLEYAFRNGGLITEIQNYDQVFFSGNGYANGLEFLLKKDYNQFQAWISYTLSEVVYQFDAINNGEAYYADHDRRHEANIYGSYDYKRWYFFATWRYGSGSPYSLIDAANFNSTNKNDIGSRVSVLEINNKNSQRLPSYHRLDIGATYSFSLGKLKTEATFSIFNLYDRTNVQDRKINQIMPGRTSRRRMARPILQTTDITLLGISPNISLRVTF